MDTKIDLKSALLGLLLGVGTMLAIGAAYSSGHNGRYQGVMGTTGAGCMLVDTVTGKVWMANSTASQVRNDSDFFQSK